MAAKYTPDMKRFKKIEKSYNIAPKSRLGTPCKTISSLTPALGRRSKSSSNITCTPTSITNKSYHHTPKNSRKQINVIETPEYFNTVTIGTPRRFTKSTSDILSDSNENQLDNEDEISNLKVAIRVRPMSVKECSNVRVKNVISCKENEVTVSSGVTADGMSGVTHSFQYDYVFSSCDIEDPNYADQKYVFNTLAAPLVDWCLKGYNVCLFAYGQTGSGKSYSMMGIDSDDPDEIGVEAGITPRFCKEIFNRIEVLKEKYFIEVEVSYFEIYNEKIHDLLTLSSEEGFINFDNTNKKSALKVREHPVFGPYVVDLSTHVVDSYKLLRDWIAVGNSQRATASTGMNDKSSRSHSIFNIVLNLTEKTSTRDENEVKLTKRSKISLVDLAGSERVCHTNVSAERLKEGVSINKSLLTLGKVIAALAETKKPNNFVPYRESVLTWLLRENLGGNSRTACLATISPSSSHLDETLSTLRYACTARKITNRVRVNEAAHDKIIRELKAEVERLRALSQHFEQMQRRNSIGNLEPRKIIIESSIDDTDILKQQLQATENELRHAQIKWQERLNEMEEVKKIETRLLKKNGLELTLAIEDQQALLINVSPNMMETGNLLYLLPTGNIKIGRSSSLSNSNLDICLNATDIANHHCSIINRGAIMYISTETDPAYKTFVNGKLLECGQRIRIYHGDRIVLGTSYFFHISNNICKNASENKVNNLHQEILIEMEKQLRKEFDKEKRNAIRNCELNYTKKISDYHHKISELEAEIKHLNKTIENHTNENIACSKTALKFIPEDDKGEHELNSDVEYLSEDLLKEIKNLLKNLNLDLLKSYENIISEANELISNYKYTITFELQMGYDEEGNFSVAKVKMNNKENNSFSLWKMSQLKAWIDDYKSNKISPNHPFELVDITWQEYTALDDSKLTPKSNMFMNLNDLRNSLSINALQRIKNVFSPEKCNQNLKEQNKENQLNTKENAFILSTKKILRDLMSSNIKLKKNCGCANYVTLSEQNSSNTILKENASKLGIIKKNILKKSEQIENNIHEINHMLTQNSIKDHLQSSPSKAVKFLIE